MIQVELNNVYINIGANNGGGNLGTKKKNTTTSDKLVKAAYDSYVYVYIFFVRVSHVG